MKLSENETNLAILNFKLRIYVGFVLSIVLTIAFIVCSITFYSKGIGEDIIWMFISLAIFTSLIAILLGVYIFRRRGE